ncbi:MAG: hypothetical protein IJT98_11190 [Prevotella sp.]|nr:hypothetical protein [Prevotella sp.]
MRAIALSVIAMLLLMASCGSRREQMVLHLEELEQRNMADSLLSNDSLAEALVAWFDNHGTPNERLRSRYILARTYADLGEAPRALEAFLDAAACADTAAPDCDFAKLSRVYRQMSELFYKQNLMDGFFEANDHSIKYAWKACDTLQALNESMYTLTAYDQKRNYDALIPMFDSLYTQFERYYGEAIASRYCIIPVKALIERRDLGKARKYLDSYESKSGYFDSSHHVNPGREDSHRDILTTSELQLCHLVRLNFDLKEIANILCINPSGISKLSAKVFAKLFNGKGSGKDLRKRLRGIS